MAPLAINTAGTVVGLYVDKPNVNHGFTRASNGTITSFSVPGAGQASGQGTSAIAINASGDVTGFYRDDKFIAHGYVRKP